MEVVALTALVLSVAWRARKANAASWRAMETQAQLRAGERSMPGHMADLSIPKVTQC